MNHESPKDTTDPPSAKQVLARHAEFVQAECRSHGEVLQETLDRSTHQIGRLALAVADAFRHGRKLLLCGNGGSAADAQHVAAEFVNRFRIDRPALPAIALTTDTSVLTCIGNDAEFAQVFSRQVEALAQPGDLLVGISTSGRSANVLRALQEARARKMLTIGFTGEQGRDTMEPLCDHLVAVASADTPRIQEVHEFVWHLVCDLVERELFGERV